MIKKISAFLLLLTFVVASTAYAQSETVKYTVAGVDFYAKLRKTDIGRTRNVSGYEQTTTVTSNLFVNFYTDAAGTIPYSVSNFTLKLERKDAWTLRRLDQIEGQGAETEEVTFICNGSEILLVGNYISSVNRDTRYAYPPEDPSGEYYIPSYESNLITYKLLPQASTPAPPDDASCTCNCLKPLFDYLIASKRLLTPKEDDVKVSHLIQSATSAGYKIPSSGCNLLLDNINKPFYATTTDSVAQIYRARIGDCTVSIRPTGAGSVNFYQLTGGVCETALTVPYLNGGTLVAKLQVDSCFTCTPATSTECYSIVTDTIINPYTFGLMGNWRVSKSYAYYVPRNSSRGTANTDIRTAGTYESFASFWMPRADKTMQRQPDESRWVWNLASTLFNRRGLELENVDPLGRYNAGLMGYDESLQVAAVQNARYRETAFEGFEDYGAGYTACGQAANCGSTRSLDFTSSIPMLDTLEQHTGLYSLKVPAGNSVGVTVAVKPAADQPVSLTFNAGERTCRSGVLGGGSEVRVTLTDIRANASAVLPGFSPLAGKKVVVSAWIKEEQDCKCTSYSGGRVSVIMQQGGTNTTLTSAAAGPIIEGWQRVEIIADVPADATSFAIYLGATGSSNVYFDDLRVHPYNANMRSYVYHPVTLRMMAELDENNYATMYEYDDDGTLIRLKKETERGVKTIKETRTGLQKIGQTN